MNMISKWGNSLGVRIPHAVIEQSGIGCGTPVRVSARKGRIILEAIAYDIDSLVAAITPQNKHKLIDSGAPVGNEVW